MTTAVIYHGQARTFAKCFTNQYWYVLRRIPNPVFYVCVEENQQATDMNLLRTRFKDVAVTTFLRPETVKMFDPVLIESSGSGYNPGMENLMRGLYARQMAWDFFTKMDKGGHMQFLFMRPDAFFRSFIMPPTPSFNQIFTNWWSRSGGVNDRVSVAGNKAAEAVMTMYDHAEELIEMGCPADGEPMIEAALELAGCYASPTLKAWCKMLRLDGSISHPEFSSDEMVMAMHGL